LYESPVGYPIINQWFSWVSPTTLLNYLGYPTMIEYLLWDSP
jgi:hypothetical protein